MTNDHCVSLQSYPRALSKTSASSHLKPKGFLCYLIILFAVYYDPLSVRLGATLKNIDNLQIIFIW